MAIESIKSKEISTEVTNEMLNEKQILFIRKELEKSIYSALSVYSNVHRGSGYNGMVSSKLFDEARKIILNYFQLKQNKYAVIFCTPRRAYCLMNQQSPKEYKHVSSKDIGLPLGIVALAVRKSALPKGVPPEVGGGTTKLISREWVIWADHPHRFEAGTPALINIVAFVIAIRQMQRKTDNDSAWFSRKLDPDDILVQDKLLPYSGRQLLIKLRETHIGRDVTVPTTQGKRKYINLDNAASTPTFEPIWNAFKLSLFQPSSVQKELISKSKSICSGFLGAPRHNYDIIFTSNTTEAINLASKHIRFNNEEDIEPVIVNSLLEHSSNDLPWRTNNNVIMISISEEGLVDYNELENLLYAYNKLHQYGKKRIKVVSVTGASNVLGVCPNLQEISRLSHKYEALLFVDAAQLIAHRKIDMESTGIDLLAFSAHKAYAPFGSGALVAKKGTLKLDNTELQNIRSSGEENVPGIVALSKALSLLQRIGMDVIGEEEYKLSEKLMQGLSRIEGISLYGPNNIKSLEFREKLGINTLSAKKKMPPVLAKMLSLHGGIGIRTGCLCSHILVKHILHVGPGLEKFQRFIQTIFPKIKLPGVARISIGLENTEEDIERVLLVLRQIALDKNTLKTIKVTPQQVNLQLKELVNIKIKEIFS